MNFALVFHLDCVALRHSELRNIFIGIERIASFTVSLETGEKLRLS